MTGPDILIVSLATTEGWRTNELELAAGLQRLGVDHRIERAEMGPSRHLRRTMPMVDAVEAAAARRALKRGLAGGLPRAIVFMGSTAALHASVARLQDQGIRIAIRLDCPAAVNRPQAASAAHRRLERRRLADADVVLAMGPRSAATVEDLARRTIVLPTPIEAPTGKPTYPPTAISYVADPDKKGLELVARSWPLVREQFPEMRLLLAGLDTARGVAYLAHKGAPLTAGLEWLGMVPRADYLAVLAEASVYVSASHREDHGITQLEALAAGVPLATTSATGAYEAEPIVEAIDARLIANDRSPHAVAAAVRRAMSYSVEQRERFRAGTQTHTRSMSRPAVDRLLEELVLPVLLES
ncbi:MAG: glycosyltransferase family 4 protein [Solirubrobacterales bacterium]